MSEPTLLAPPLTAGAPGGVVRLEAEEARHARALRLDAGAALALTDGRGRRWSAELVELERDSVACRLVAPLATPPPGRVDLWFGVGSKDRTLWLVEKAVELGARKLVPIECARSRSVADAGRSAGFLAKMERRGEAALKQCGGALLPQLRSPRSLREALAEAAPGPRLLADPGASRPLAERARALAPGVAVTYLVGPEGGLEEDEVEACGAAGFELVGLGPRILRFETAAIAGLALLAADGGRAARADEGRGNGSEG